MFSCFVFLINAAKLQNYFQKTKYTDIFLIIPPKSAPHVCLLNFSPTIDIELLIVFL